MKIKIKNNRYIGEDSPCYIVMDAAANHNGDLDTAVELVKEAAKNGADAIKFQTYTAEGLYSTKCPLFSYVPISAYELIKKVQHPREWLPILNDIANKNNIDFTSSAFDYEAVDLLEQINVPFHKIASCEIVDLDLIEYVAKKQKPVIISTGMANIGEIEDAVNVMLKINNNNIILLHCNTIYPTPFEAVNLKAIETLKRVFEYPVGFSDHTLGIHISLAAVSLGAKVIERHFTLDKSQEGPDHAVALDPSDLKELVINVRDIEKSFGNGVKRPHELESENYEKGRRSIIAARDIPKGTTITRDMLIIKRPSYGIKPKLINLVIGRKAKVDIEYDQWITWDMI